MNKLFAAATLMALVAGASVVTTSDPASAVQSFPDHGRLYANGAGSGSAASGAAPFVNPTQVLRQALVPIQIISASPNAVGNGSMLPNMAPRKKK